MNEQEILARVAAFEETTLPAAEWTHAAHLTTALVYVRRYGREGAMAPMRAGLKRYVVAIGGNVAAYHETITRAWVEVIAGVDAEQAGSALAEVARVLVERCDDKGYLARYYSRERLMSDEARGEWVEPDIAPIG